MRIFKDSKGRPWTLEINVTQIKRVRDLVKVNLFGLIDDGLKPLAELMADPVKLVDVIFALIIDQAGREKITDEDFGRAMAGDSIQQAAEAFTEELFDFFPEVKDRLTLRKVLNKQKEIASALADENNQLIDTLIPQEEARRILRVSRPSGSSGSVQQPCESIQAAGDCAT